MTTYPLDFKQRLVMTVLAVLFQIVHVVATLWLISATWIKPSPERTKRLALSYDQLGNVVMGGHEDETISSRLGRKGSPVWLITLVNWVFFKLYGEVNHCQAKIEERFRDA